MRLYTLEWIDGNVYRRYPTLERGVDAKTLKQGLGYPPQGLPHRDTKVSVGFVIPDELVVWEELPCRHRRWSSTDLVGLGFGWGFVSYKMEADSGLAAVCKDCGEKVELRFHKEGGVPIATYTEARSLGWEALATTLHPDIGNVLGGQRIVAAKVAAVEEYRNWWGKPLQTLTLEHDDDAAGAIICVRHVRGVMGGGRRRGGFWAPPAPEIVLGGGAELYSALVFCEPNLAEAPWYEDQMLVVLPAGATFEVARWLRITNGPDGPVAEPLPAEKYARPHKVPRRVRRANAWVPVEDLSA